MHAAGELGHAGIEVDGVFFPARKRSSIGIDLPRINDADDVTENDSTDTLTCQRYPLRFHVPVNFIVRGNTGVTDVGGRSATIAARHCRADPKIHLLCQESDEV